MLLLITLDWILVLIGHSILTIFYKFIATESTKGLMPIQGASLRNEIYNTQTDHNI